MFYQVILSVITFHSVKKVISGLMKLSDWTRNLTAAILELNATREKDAILVVKEGIALVKLRVINEGVRADGVKFSPYSKNTLPWFYFGSSYGKNGLKLPDFNIQASIEKLKKKAKKEKVKGQSYFDWRAILGRPTAFKNFSLTGDMWASIREFVASKSKTEVVVEIKSSIAFHNETIIPAHSNREGINILQTSPDERKLVFAAFRDRRLNVLRRNGVIR